MERGLLVAYPVIDICTTEQSVSLPMKLNECYWVHTVYLVILEVIQFWPILALHLKEPKLIKAKNAYLEHPDFNPELRLC